MQLSYVKCSPGGNITVLLYTEVPEEQRAFLSNQIMGQLPDVEQVGFLQKPERSEAAVRLQMSGGEFCGNAARCCAWLHSQGRALRKQARDESDSFLLEVSGTSRLLRAEVYGEVVRVEMPIKEDARLLINHQDCTLVPLEGISHLIVPVEEPPDDLYKKSEDLMQMFGLLDKQAAGIIYWQLLAGQVRITPVVWVRETRTLIAETACASGTISLILSQAIRQGDGRMCMQVEQPSGSHIGAAVTLRGTCFSDATIEGPVQILDQGTLEVSGF